MLHTLKQKYEGTEDWEGKNFCGYTFDWTDKFIKENGGEDDYFMRKKDTGIIAQEIEEILPEVVATRPNGTKAVKYDKLTPLLIQAIKELKTELDD